MKFSSSWFLSLRILLIKGFSDFFRQILLRFARESCLITLCLISRRVCQVPRIKPKRFLKKRWSFCLEKVTSCFSSHSRFQSIFRDITNNSQHEHSLRDVFVSNNSSASHANYREEIITMKSVFRARFHQQWGSCCLNMNRLVRSNTILGEIVLRVRRQLTPTTHCDMSLLTTSYKIAQMAFRVD